jgi:hypothetical protein
MKTALSVIKAEVDSIGGYTTPSAAMLDAVRRDAAGARSEAGFQSKVSPSVHTVRASSIPLEPVSAGMARPRHPTAWVF